MVCSWECGAGLFIRESPQFAAMSDEERRELVIRAADQVHELAYLRDVRARGPEGRAGMGKRYRGLSLARWPRKAIGASTAEGIDAELLKAGLRLQSAAQVASIGDDPDEGSTTWRRRPGGGRKFTAKGGGGFEVPLPRLSEDEAALLAWLLGKAAGIVPEITRDKEAA
jgi:hypothetical protein